MVLVMRVETASWSATTGWVPSLPVPDARPTLVLAFGRSRPAGDPQSCVLDAPLAELHARWSEHVVVGCSTPEQLAATVDPSVELAVTVVRFERTTLRHHDVEVAAAGGPRAVGRTLAGAVAHPELRGVLVLGDAHAANASAVSAGFAERLPAVAMTGGMAGEGIGDAPTWTLVGGRRVAGHVTAVGLVGEHLELGFGSAGGWDVLGPERLVTQSYGTVLYEMDGKPALSLLRELVDAELRSSGGELDGVTVAFPLAVRDLDDREVVRTVWSGNPVTDSLRCGGDVPQGAVAQLLQGAPDRLVEGAFQAARLATGGDDELAIAVSCVGRLAVLGDRISEETDAAREALPPAVPLTGFYSFASFAPAIGGSDVHNQVLSITTLRERPVLA